MKSFQGATWGGDIYNGDLFYAGLKQAVSQFKAPAIFFGDNLFTWGRNLSFLDDEKFMLAFNRHAATAVEKMIIWRTHIYVWCIEQALRRPGDLVDCGCYKGISVRIACDCLNLSESGKKFYLYDLFDHAPDMPHGHMPEHGPHLYDQVCERFRDLPSVKVIQGKVPQVLAKARPRKIAFLHLDLNNADAEIGALDVLFGKMTPGGLILLDDYGWINYREQKLREDEFFSARGLRVMELPTGQGLVIA